MPLPQEVLATLPEDIRGSEHLAPYNDVPSLVKDLITVKTSDWKTNLPDDLKADPSIVQYKNLPDFAKGFVETKKMVGQSLRAPAADAPDEEWEKFYRAGGKPSSPDEYKFSAPEGVLTPEEEKGIREEGYRLGLNNRQIQKRVDMFASEKAEFAKFERAELEKTEQTLRQKWGANFDRNKALIERTLDRIDPNKELRAYFDMTGLGNHPVLINLFHEWGKRLVEDGLMPGDVQGVTGREEALKKLAEIDADPKHPYHASKHGDPIFEEVWKLRQIAYD